mgnify:CR=1 FL=1
MFGEEITMPIGDDFEQFLLDKMSLFTKRTIAHCPRLIFRESPSVDATAAGTADSQEDTGCAMPEEDDARCVRFSFRF